MLLATSVLRFTSKSGFKYASFNSILMFIYRDFIVVSESEIFSPCILESTFVGGFVLCFVFYLSLEI